MHHITMDGFQGFRSRFDDLRLIHEILEEIPDVLETQPVMQPFILPYYNGVDAEDCGISAFVFLAGGHLTVHTFSFRECYFADLVYPEPVEARRFRHLLEGGLPCESTKVQSVTRVPASLMDGKIDEGNDFGPHLFLDVDDYRGPSSLSDIFALLDRLPERIGMTPIMRPYCLQGRSHDGSPVLSGMTMIAESHISLHVFPDDRRAHFDLFSCRFFDHEQVSHELRYVLPGGAHHEALIARGQDYMRLRGLREREVSRSRNWLRALGTRS